jgi:hypothetical protein
MKTLFDYIGHWTIADSGHACEEGWDLCRDETLESYEVRRRGDEHFTSDRAAMTYVAEKARSDLLCSKALLLIAKAIIHKQLDSMSLYRCIIPKAEP